MFTHTGARLPGKAKYTFQQGVIVVYTEALCFSSTQRTEISLSYNQLGTVQSSTTSRGSLPHAAAASISRHLASNPPLGQPPPVPCQTSLERELLLESFSAQQRPAHTSCTSDQGSTTSLADLTAPTIAVLGSCPRFGRGLLSNTCSQKNTPQIQAGAPLEDKWNQWGW